MRCPNGQKYECFYKTWLFVYKKILRMRSPAVLQLLLTTKILNHDCDLSIERDEVARQSVKDRESPTPSN